MIHRSDGPHVIDERHSGSEGASEELVDLLSDPHCRYLLKYLKENDGRTSVSAATRYVVAEITDTAPENISEDVERRVQTWFHHGQLPTLDAYGVVDFDPEEGTVGLTDDSAE